MIFKTFLAYGYCSLENRALSATILLPVMIFTSADSKAKTTFTITAKNLTVFVCMADGVHFLRLIKHFSRQIKKI